MNPLFPLNEYIPDGEAHVFGDRVYLYGSHDAENSDRFCVQDYSVWSAPVSDLSSWSCKEKVYLKSQDPRSRDGRLADYYAPDCVRGNDGRYYLYYFAAGPNTSAFGPMSVAVSESPDGPFEYLSDIKYKNGAPVLKFLTNDPAVINDNGRIWLYYGWGLGRDFRSKVFSPLYRFVLSKLTNRSYREVKETSPSILSCAVVELENDMCTVKSEPKAVLDSKTTADKSSELYRHPFYEAPCIRKINDLYYLIYSSGENNELAYATSKFPDRDFQYRGVIISNSDLGYRGNKQRKAPAGTIHGSIEQINGKYYVFYHRCTNNTDFSRQACAEPVTINADGTINQVEITTQGVGAPLPAAGEYSAALCCNLYNRRTKNVQGNGKGDRQPNIASRNGESFVTAITNGTVIGFKYFNFKKPVCISVTVRNANGRMDIKIGDRTVGIIPLSQSTEWKTFFVKIDPEEKTDALYFIYRGKGKADFLKMELS